MTQVASDSLLWIKNELDSTLVRSRQELEQFAEHQEDTDALKRCLDHLHQVQGTLRMVEVYGAAMLAEEMEAVTRALVDGRVKEINDAFEVLMRAMLQLPDYLERVVGGQRDVPLALLSLLNDLRSVRGEPLLSESALFAQDMAGRSTATVGAERIGKGGDISATAKKVRPKFQAALLGWYKGDKPGAHLKTLAAAAEKLEQAATTPPVFQLWWIVGGVLEALNEDGLEANVGLKQLLGQVDRQIKRLIDRGEEDVSREPPTELVNNLLYYVGKAESDGERVRGIKESFNLSELLPEEEQIAKVRERLSGPNAGLMRTVSSALKEDLARVKDTLDIFVRMNKGDVDELEPLADLLKKVTDTLGVLGLQKLRSDVEQERALLGKIVAGEAELNDAALMEVAGALIRVEENLDDQMLSVASRDSAEQAASEAGIVVEEAEFKQVSGAVIRESIVNLARVKEVIGEFINNPRKREVLEPVPGLVRQIQAGLRLLEMERPGEILEAIRYYIRNKIFGAGRVPPEAELDRMADAIVSVEFYLETIQQGRGDPQSMLDNAEACVEALGVKVGEIPADDDLDAVAAEPEVPAGDSESAKAEPGGDDEEPSVVGLEVGEADAEEPESEQPEAEQSPAVEAEPAAEPKADVPPPPEPDEISPEIAEIFLEEAQEELESIREQFPRWKSSPENTEALSTVRRSFHTLKGSGRMVGAERIGEFAWSVENMLNRVIDGTIPATDNVFSVVEDAVAALPELVEQLEKGTEVRVDLAGIMGRAEALASGEAIPETEESEIDREQEKTLTGEFDVNLEAPAEQEGADAEPSSGAGETADENEAPETTSDSAHASTDSGESTGFELDEFGGFDEEETDDEHSDAVSAKAEPAMDPVLYDIFRREADGHLAVIDEILEEASGELEVSEELTRALHTLNGSAHTAGVGRIPDIVYPFECNVRERQKAGESLTEEHLEVLRDVTVEVRRILDALQTPEGPGEPDRSLLARIEALPGAEAAPEQTGQSVGESSAEAPARTTRPVGRIPLEELDEFDSELAAVFLEEAHELQSAIDEALHEWQGDHDNPEHVSALQRHLHTLKGGARMAGIAPMGDLSHELESLLTEIVDGRMQVSEELFQLLQRCVDRLHQMIEQVETNAPVIDGADLVREVERAQARAGAVFDADIPASTAGEASAADAGEPAAPAAPVEEKAPERESEYDPGTQGDRRAASRIQQEVVRVRADLLENLLNNAGEVSIYRARLEQTLSQMNFHLTELDQTVERLREQFRKLEIEIEAQVLYQFEEEGVDQEDFDPLELDRYSQVQQLSRALMETVSDLVSLQGLMSNQAREAETLLMQQSRVNTDLQDGLMRTRMLPFSQHAQRLRRIVRQTAQETGKKAELSLEGADSEMDRQVLERVIAPLEHMLRNSVIHGLEGPAARKEKGKSETGTVKVHLRREGSEVIIDVLDDGGGLNIEKIREKAERQGLATPNQDLNDSDIMQFILETGFSTATEVTQSAGRGVGMDVVYREIKQLGGNLAINSEEGKGARFTIHLPFTLAITQALLVNVADEIYAIPLPSIEGVVRVSRGELQEKLESDNPTYTYGGREYELQHLGVLLGMGAPQLSDDVSTVPVLLVRSGDHSTAMITEGMQGSREIVVKSVGPQIANIRGVSGATILGDGSIVMILDVAGLVRVVTQLTNVSTAELERSKPVEDDRIIAMVVDDSITMRRVSQRLLERHGMRVVTAKDGVDALAELQDTTPDVMLLDIEMPRMDGYELATHMRNDETLKDIPIIMITSRSGEKHRNRAMDIGVNRYLGKPYQETELLENIQALVGNFNPQRTRWE